MKIRNLAAITAAMVLTAACLTGCVTVTVSDGPNGADSGLETFEDDHWSATYDPKELTMFVNEDETLFSYTKEGVDISGSQYSSFKFIPDKTASEVIDEKKAEYNDPDGPTYDTMFGLSGIAGISYLVNPGPAEGSELSVSVDYTAIDVDGGTVLVENYSTLGNDEETGYMIAAAFEQLMDTLTVK